VVDGQIGQIVPLQVASLVQNSYTQYAFADIRIVSPESNIIFTAADSCNLGDVTISASLESLALSVVELEQWCQIGACPLQLRDRVVDDINGVITFVQAASSSITADDTLQTIATDMSSHSDNADIAADISALATTVTALEGELCELGEHLPTAGFSPTLDAILLGQSTTYTLSVTNDGSLTTTYAITASLPGDDASFNQQIPPGATVDLPLPMTPASLGLYALEAEIVATAPDVQMDVTTMANAWLNVVDKFVQVTAVTADPAFVETGISSIDLSMDVTNVASVARESVARTSILAPNGNISYTADLPVTILIGSPRTYLLDTVDTSGWTADVYTITLDLLDGKGALIPDGHGFGFLSVGQAMGASQAVRPVLVAPGTVTVTTIITTEIVADTILSRTQAAPLWPPTGLRAIDTGPLVIDDSGDAQLDTGRQSMVDEKPEAANSSASGNRAPLISQSLLTASAITRTEQTNPAIVYAGSWQQVSNSRASGGNYHRGDALGETATFTFNGSWINIGFVATRFSGETEVYLDGVSLDVIDLYRRDDTALSFIYDGLISGTHTISVSVLGTSNPFAGNDYVQVDFFDTWDGTTFLDGTFEQDDPRIFKGPGWSNVNNPVASGGSYIWDNAATAWFPFTGSSVTYQAIAHNSGGKARVFLDGAYQTTLNLHNSAVITRSLSFTGLVPGPHILQINHYRGSTTLDTFITPANGDHYVAPVISGFTRFEEDDPAMLYNGVPFTVTTQTWTRSDHIYNSEASDGQYIYSNTVDDMVSFTFDGVWAGIGFFTDNGSGQAEIFLDGVSQGVVDLYSNEEDVTSFTYSNLNAGSHTISVTVLGTSNPLSGNSYVYMDYVDAWDGSSLVTGQFEQDDGRVLRSGGWTDAFTAGASGGSYMEEVLNSASTAWIPFTDDSITYQAFNYFRSNEVAIYVDDSFQGYYDIRDSSGVPTITHSFANLGSGLHIFKVRHYRDEATVDAFHIPAIVPPTPPPAPTIFSRYEEDDRAILYNGLPYAVTVSTWNRTDDSGRASDGQYISSNATGDWVSFVFTGTWVNAGFLTGRNKGQAEVFIDGVSQGMIDLYSRDFDVASFAYGGLTDTNHTISVIVTGANHPNSSGTEIAVDYFDTWNGASLPPGTYEESDALVMRSDDYDDWNVVAEPAASGGLYMDDNFFSNDGAVWFPFTGDSVTFLGLANSKGDRVRIDIDGVTKGTFNLYNSTPITRAFSFDGLGGGSHVMQIRHNRGEPNIDAFILPGVAPFQQTTIYTGVVRYEEDHPALLYNGLYDFRQRPNSWSLNKTRAQVSGRWMASSSTVGDTVSLIFDGHWANVGFKTSNNAGKAQIFVDGVSQGVVNLDNDAGEDVTSVQFGNLITGTHTISVAVVSGAVHLDYIEVWDGQATSDDYVNVRRAEDSGRIHYSASIKDGSSANAYLGDYATTTLLNTNSNIWYTFVGDSFIYLAYSRQYGGTAEVYVDGILIDTVDLTYPFTEQPITHHYTGFAPGPHVVRIHNGVYLRVDAFQSNPTQLTSYAPTVEWYDNEANGGSGSFGTPGGMLMGIAAGDIDGDGEVEIIAPSDTFTTGGFINSIFIYRGDGEDAGNGSPLIRRIDFASYGIDLGRESIGSVALADLNGQPGAEIIVGSERGMYAFHGDGLTYWFTDTFQGPGNATTVTPAVGNLDLDLEPEIVVNMNQTLVVYDANGAIAWSQIFTSEVGMPLLADLTGDGLLDIVAYDVNGHVRLYDYNLGTPQLLWQTALSTTIGIVRGGPAVVDVDGDGAPEIAISNNGYHTVLDKDGNVVWSTQLDPGAPGGVSVADVDGDGEIEIVTGMRYDDGIGVGQLYALNADGSILWQRPAYDHTSANSQSVLDVNGDGIYEIAWNGAEYGFTIFNGEDGAILFNEPLVESLTATDYPIFADVDQDGFAEIVVPSNDGIRVFGFDGAWDPSRPLWNQHSYHISNINDDLTVPFSELNSWDIHNTYRTQTNLTDPAPSYGVSRWSRRLSTACWQI